MIIQRGTTSQTLTIFVPDSSSSAGAGLTGLAYNTSGLSAYYYRHNSGSSTVITLADATLGTWTSGGFKEIDSTNMPGWYEVGVPNAALAIGAEFVGLCLHGAANMAPVNLRIDLVHYDAMDGDKLGLSGLATDAAVAAIDTVANAVKAKTDNLPLDPASHSHVLTLGTQVSNLNNISEAEVNAQCDAAIADAALATAANLATVAGVVDSIASTATAIKAKTDNLPDDPADQSLIIAAIDGLNDVSLADVNAACDEAISDANLSTAPSVDAIKARTDNLPVNTAGELDAIDSAIAGLNNVSTSDVTTACASAIATYDAPTKAELDSGLASLNDIASADVQSACGAAITAAGISAADIADTVLDEAMSEHTTAGSVGEAISNASGSSATPEDIATAVWAKLTSAMTTAGSIGKKLADWVVGNVTAVAGDSVTSITDFHTPVIRYVTTSGAAATTYIDRPALEAIYGASNIAEWANLECEEPPVEADDRIAQAILWAEGYFTTRMRGGPYDLPLVTSDSNDLVVVRDIIARYAGKWIYEAKGQEQDDVTEGVLAKFNFAENTVDRLLNGSLKLSARRCQTGRATAPQVRGR